MNFKNVQPRNIWLEILFEELDFFLLLPGLLIWWGEFNFSIDSAGPQKGRVQDVNAICGHDDLQVTVTIVHFVKNHGLNG